jgi:hypothetical protein
VCFGQVLSCGGVRGVVAVVGCCGATDGLVGAVQAVGWRAVVTRPKPGGRGECLGRLLWPAGMACFGVARLFPPSWLEEPNDPARESEAARHATTADRPNADTTGRRAAWREL